MFSPPYQPTHTSARSLNGLIPVIILHQKPSAWNFALRDSENAAENDVETPHRWCLIAVALGSIGIRFRSGSNTDLMRQCEDDKP